MASSKQQLTHPNPHVQRVLDFAATREARGQVFASAADLCRQAGDHYGQPLLGTKAIGRQVRQVWRDAGMGVGRGHTYAQPSKGKVASHLLTGRKRQVAQAKQQAKQAQPKQPAA